MKKKIIIYIYFENNLPRPGIEPWSPAWLFMKSLTIDKRASELFIIEAFYLYKKQLSSNNLILFWIIVYHWDLTILFRLLRLLWLIYFDWEADVFTHKHSGILLLGFCQEHDDGQRRLWWECEYSQVIWVYIERRCYKLTKATAKLYKCVYSWSTYV